MKLSRKQHLTLNLLDDPQITDLLFGGGAGSGKSMLVSTWALLQIRNYPGIRIGLGRKELTRLKQTTVVTMLHEVHPILKVNTGDFTYNDQKATIEYRNGGMIQLVDLARQPSDPEYDRFGSMLFTHVIVEEGGEVIKKARDVFISRKNRFLNKHYNIVGKSITTCNPSQNFLKTEYYKPYKELGAGEWQRWEHGKVKIDGVKKQAYRVFIRSLATDNPFVDPNYIEVLRQLPTAERKRLLEGDWDFEDTDKMLFKPVTIDKATTDELSSGERSIGVDLADTGSDKTIISLVEDGILVDQKAIEVDKTEAIGEQIALEIIKYAQQNGITHEHAGQIGIDTVGIGASTRDFMRSKGWYIREFVAGAKTEGNFKNLRGETIWNFSQALEKGEFRIYKRLPTLDTLREQLMAHEYETQERTILIKSKDKIKETLGVSPDYAESAYIAYWAGNRSNDPKYDSSRVSF